ncbi:zinc-finger domain-containing protein [soil metagenome]
MTQASQTAQANQASSAVELDGKDLPAHCPNPAMPIWSSHPRVFLELLHGEAKCPYCGTVYRLKPGAIIKGH